MFVRRDEILIRIDRLSYRTDREYYCEIIKQKGLTILQKKKESIEDKLLK